MESKEEKQVASKEEEHVMLATWKTEIESSGHYLYCTTPGAGAVAVTTTVPNNRLWVFHQIEGNLFNILNAVGASNGNSFLSCAEDGNSVCLVAADDGSGRQRFTLKKVSAGLYNINVAGGVTGNKSFLSANYNTGYVKLEPADLGACQQWKLKVALVDVSFILDEGRILGNTPQVVAVQTLTNTTSITQSMSFQVAEKVEETSTFENAVGVSLSIGTTFSTGLPLVANGEISAELTTEFTHTFGQTNTFSTEVTSVFPIAAPPNKKVVCEAIVTKANLVVPYVFNFADGSTERGMWDGVSAWALRDKLTESDIQPDESDMKSDE